MEILWLIGELSRDNRNFCFRLGSTCMVGLECWKMLWDVTFFNFYRFSDKATYGPIGLLSRYKTLTYIIKGF